MEKFIIKTTLRDMFQISLDLYNCPNCNVNFPNNIRGSKWITEEFIRFTCNNCGHYIYFTSVNCVKEDLI